MHNLNTVESQDNLCDCNEGKRKTDVLISTIEKCEKLQKQLDIAVEALQYIYEDTKGGHTQCDACGYCDSCESCINAHWADKALKQIKDLDR